MNKSNHYRKISVVAIPFYVEDNLVVNGLSLNYLDDLLNNYGYKNYVDTNIVNLNNQLDKALSTMDMSDWVGMNKLIHENIISYYGRTDINSLVGVEKFLKDFTWDDNYDIENLTKTFIDKKIDALSVIMNADIKHSNELFELKFVGDTVFMVVRKGFMNYLSLGNNEKFKIIVRTILMNFLFGHFEEERVYISDIFRRYVSSKVNKI